MSSNNCFTVLLPHQGRHPNDYHEFVLEKLIEIDTKSNGDTNPAPKNANTTRTTHRDYYANKVIELGK